jgi:alkylhydroperoxidase/carboxymuconolactone decarboxylase family protein YurZ
VAPVSLLALEMLTVRVWYRSRIHSMEVKDMEDQKVEEILRQMERMLGEEPRPMVLMSKVLPQWIPRQAEERKFVFDLPNIPAKYKHLIMVAVAAAVSSHLCTETFIKLAKRSGVTNGEIAEAIIAARFALASTVFASSVEGLETLSEP